MRNMNYRSLHDQPNFAIKYIQSECGDRLATMTATSTATMAMAAINNQQFNSGYRVENVASGANENINNIPCQCQPASEI